MQDINSHIAYLLTKHECVILPGLGAFVVSPSEKETISRWRILSPPENYLGFNSEIKHHDELLVNSIIKEKKCSYEEAYTLIDQYITQVLYSFDEGEKVCIPWVGTLYQKDDEILFRPEKTLSCNASNFGLTGFLLPYMHDIQQETTISPPKKINKETVSIPVSKRFIAYIIAIAAALIAIFFIPSTLNDKRTEPAPNQYASVVQIQVQYPVNDEEDTQEEIIQEQVETIVTPENTTTSNTEKMNQINAITFSYYIIVASLPTQTAAINAIAELKSKGIENADIIFSDGRYRIYTNHFEDREEAEEFLVQFLKDNPIFTNAWLLKQKVN